MNVSTLPKKLTISLIFLALLYALLLGLITLDALTLSSGFWPAWLLQITPLLLLLPGLAIKHYRSYSWLCFLMLLYFTSFVIQVYSPTRDSHDWVALCTSIILFTLAMFSSRWLQRHVKGAIDQ